MTKGDQTHDKHPGWENFVAFEAEPHHQPVNAPKLIKRGSERLGSLAASIQHRFSDVKNKKVYSETMCRILARNMIHENDLPSACQKYEGLVKDLEERKKQYRRGA